MNTIAATIFDEWEIYSDNKSQLTLDVETEYTLTEDPLAVLLQTLGADASKWYERTYLFSEVKEKLKNNIAVDIEPFARDLSEKIKSYYRNKYFLNRFKNRKVSSFQETVEYIISDSNTLKENHFAPLFKIPYFYIEDMEVESILKDSVTLTRKTVSHIEDDFCFIGKINRFGKTNDRYFRFVLQNSKKQLLSIVVTNGNTSYPLWNHLFEEKANINFKGHVALAKFKGTDFYYYNIDNSTYDIRINKV